LVEPLVKTSDATDAPLELRMKQPKGILSAARVRLKFPLESAVAAPATGGFPKVTHESWYPASGPCRADCVEPTALSRPDSGETWKPLYVPPLNCPVSVTFEPLLVPLPHAGINPTTARNINRSFLAAISIPPNVRVSPTITSAA
jgi:hypothetical protein